MLKPHVWDNNDVSVREIDRIGLGVISTREQTLSRNGRPSCRAGSVQSMNKFLTGDCRQPSFEIRFENGHVNEHSERHAFENAEGQKEPEETIAAIRRV